MATRTTGLILGLLLLGACGGGGGGGSEEQDAAPRNLPILVDAGADQAVDDDALVTLRANVQDLTGFVPAVHWEQVAGPGVTLSDPSASVCTFTAPRAPAGGELELVFVLRATAPTGAASDTVRVTVQSSSFVLFVLDPGDDAPHVVRTDVRTGDSTRVSPDAAIGDVSGSSLQISPDGTRFCYLANHETEAWYELYVGTVDGQTRHRVSPTITDREGRVRSSGVKWDPTGTRLAFQADPDGDGRHSLYIVRADGTASTIPHPALGDGDEIQQYDWSPSGDRLAFIASLGGTAVARLYVVDVDTGSATEVSGKTPTPPAPGFPLGVSFFRWSPDGTNLAFVGDLTKVGVSELYVVPPTGGARVTLNVPLASDPSGNPGRVEQILWTPNGDEVLYVASTELGRDPHELYATRPDGSNKRQLTSIPDGHDGVAPTTPIRISPNGTHLLHEADHLEAGTEELFVIRLDAVSGPSPATTSGFPTGGPWGFSADSQWVFSSHQPSVTVGRTLWAGSLDGSIRRAISPASTQSADFALAGVATPDHTKLAWIQAEDFGGPTSRISIRVANTDGTGAAEIVPPPAVGEVAFSTLSWSPDGALLVYTVRSPVGDETYFAVAPDGTGVRQISPPATGPALSDHVVWRP